FWQTATGQSLGPPLVHHGPASVVAFSPDGRLVFTGSDDKTAQLWDAGTHKPFGPPLPHAGRISAVAFHPRGTVVATCANRTVRLWETATGSSIGQAFDLPYNYNTLAFSSDGHLLLTGSRAYTVTRWFRATGGEAQLWEATTGKPIEEPLQGEIQSA